MADDDPYDSDGDVGRFLRSPSPDDTLFPLSQPDGTIGGLVIQNVFTDEQAQGNQAAALITEGQGQTVPEFGVQASATEYQGHPAAPLLRRNAAPGVRLPAPEFGVQLPATEEVQGHQAPIINGEHHHQATTGMDAVPYQALSMDFVHQTHMLPPQMQRRYGFPADPTLHGEHFDAPIMDAHVPTINAVVQPATNTVAPGTTMMQMLQAYGAILDPTPPPMHQQGGGGGNGVHGEQYQAAPIINAHQYQPPTINSEYYQPPIINAESHHQAVPGMAMPVVQPVMNTPMAPEMMMHMQQSNGALFPNPTTPMQQGGVSLLAGDSTRRPSTPTLSTMMDELAAMLDAGGVRYGADAADADAPTAGAEEDDVAFMPIDRGQLDCTRCRPTREITDDSAGTHKTYFAVHSMHPGTFEHAIIDGMSVGADGQFHANDLLYCDLRGRSHEWVQNFIAKNVEKMKNCGGQPRDICGPSNGGRQPQDNISAPQPSDHAHMEHGNQAHNNISAPQPSNNAADMELDNHAHMELEIAMLNNILAGTAQQAAHPEEATQPAAQAQGNTTDAPSVVVEEQVTQVSQAAGVKQAQENTDAAPSVAEAAATSPPTTEENNAGAATPPVPDVESPELPAAAEPSTSPPAEHNTLDIGEQFAPFNWEGFKPHILESSEVPPYDPASSGSVLMYPSLLEQLQQQELKKKERMKLSSMAVTDTPGYLNINDDHYANAPNFESEEFKRLCQRDPTYRLYKTRVSGLTRKIKKLEQTATKVGTGGLFSIKQKMESFKSEKEKIYATIKRAMEVNGRRNNDGAGPSNVAATTSNDNEAGPSNVAATTSNNEAGPSNVAGTFNDHDGPSSAAGCSNVAGPSGTK